MGYYRLLWKRAVKLLVAYLLCNSSQTHFLSAVRTAVQLL